MTVTHSPFILPKERAIIIIGNYGSGKSEVAVNWAIKLNDWKVPNVSIADLDVVNPYFRCREAVEVMEQKGINVVVPRGGHFFADLPIVLPEIKGLFQHQVGTAIFDVGGEDTGAKILASFEGFISNYDLIMVVNSNRPFTNTVKNVKILISKIEAASSLKISGLVGNTHLMENTTVETIVDGYEFLNKVSESTEIPIRFITAHTSLYEKVLAKKLDVPLLPLDRILTPPWVESGIVKTRKSGPTFQI
jgi:hypothetical protein